MSYDNDKLRRVFERTDGECHICRGKLSFSNYGKADKRGGWEVEHSVPRSRGGSDSLNNLYPAHVACNRSKGSSDSRSARREHGFQAAPLPAKIKTRNAITGGALGTVAAYILVPPHLRLVAMLVTAVAGAVAGTKYEPK